MAGDKRIGLLSLTVLGLAACSGNGLPKPHDIQARVALESFSSCADLQKYIAETAVLDMRSQIEQEKRGGGPVRAMDGAPGTPGPATAGADAQGPSSFTTTNTQVAGVDEADFVKNDGTRIFVVAGNKLYLNQSWPPSQLRTVGRLEIEGWPREMFLDEQNHLVVFSTVYTPYPLVRGAAWPGAAMPCSLMDCGYYHGNSTKVTLIDVADLARPLVQQEFFFPGYYTSSRRIGSSVRIVLGDQFRWPADVRWFPEYDAQLYQDRKRWERALDELMARNEAIIRQQPLDAWLPHATHKLPDGSLENLEYSCSDFSKTNGPTRLGIVTVATLNLDRPDRLAQTSIIAEPGQIYASPRALYVATTHWWWWPEPGQQDHTYLHKLDISLPDKAIYVASGGVAGHIVDQFSMDEDASERFRIATNLSTRVVDAASPWGRLVSSNRVSVLAEASGSLQVIGQTEELSPGERIFSSRFVGNKAFVVTFRQIDPFFTLDLSDPTRPTKVGELKVPGFSSYIHPIDDRNLLTIGQYVPEGGGWQGRAVKLSIFDVTDFANPIERFTQLVGTSYGSTEAAYNHKAFNYFPAKKLLALPFSDYDPRGCATYWCGFVSDLRVFRIDPAQGISPVGALRMNDVYQTINVRDWSYSWAPWVRRSVMADDFAYAISDAGIRVADVGSLDSPIRTVLFDPRN